MTIKETNGKRIAEILTKAGPDDVIFQTQNEWDLRIYYSNRGENTMTIEMCSTIEYQGDTLFDPLMRIELTLDSNGQIKEAIPLYYISRTLFCEEEIYAKGNPDCWDPRLYKKADELDSRLSEWLDSIEIQGYLTNGEIIKA